MPVKRSSTGGALSWVVAVVVLGAVAVGAGWLIGQQALNWWNPDRSSSAKTDSEDTGYSYYPWKDTSTDTSGQTASSGAAQTQTQAQTQTPTPAISLPQSTVPATAPPGSSETGKFYRVRVGSFATREAAMETAMELEAQGHPIFVTGGGPWSVQVGAFARRENAIALSDRLANQGYDVTIHE
ncbi:MAG: SPOR domain-containing protein [Firmicutes bacterium]|nr:SPOR domain-containing protein [Bacillota bacterium]